MGDLKRKIFCSVKKFIKKKAISKRIEFNKFLFYFLLGAKNELLQFKMNINTKCLVLSQYPGAETKGLGGLIAQYPKNFEVLCFTNGSNMLSEFSAIESASIKKQQFHDVMKTLRAKGSKIFDLECGTLKNHYSTFKKIDISEADYIFIPNVYDENPDTIALLRHFKNLLNEKGYKKDLKIIMFESDYALCSMDYFVNISTIAATKKRVLEQFYPQNKFPNMTDKVLGLNAYRAIKHECDYVETFMALSVDEFLNIPMI